MDATARVHHSTRRRGSMAAGGATAGTGDASDRPHQYELRKSARRHWRCRSSGLNETGFFLGRNLLIEYRASDGQVDRLPALVADLVQRKVDLIFGNSTVAVAAKAATSTIPIVFVTSVDPVAGGIVASLNHPGGNVTGVLLRAGDEATSKLIELVHELLPATTTIGMLIDPKFLDTGPGTAAVQTAVTSLGLKVVVAEATVDADLEPTISKLAEAHVGALLIGENIYRPIFKDRIASVAMRNRLPTFGGPSFAARALASYGASDFDSIRRVGIYMGRILKGEKPGELPVLLPTKFELVINLKIAKELGVTVPSTLLARADEVIEWPPNTPMTLGNMRELGLVIIRSGSPIRLSPSDR
jgi:putative ABC transport system substrate-binding protein